jgi:hypothetical protein
MYAPLPIISPLHPCTAHPASYHPCTAWVIFGTMALHPCSACLPIWHSIPVHVPYTGSLLRAMGTSALLCSSAIQGKSYGQQNSNAIQGKSYGQQNSNILAPMYTASLLSLLGAISMYSTSCILSSMYCLGFSSPFILWHSIPVHTASLLSLLVRTIHVQHIGNSSPFLLWHSIPVHLPSAIQGKSYGQQNSIILAPMYHPCTSAIHLVVC